MKQNEKEGYIESLKKFSDRELQELQTFYAAKIEEHTRKTHGVVNFLFILTIIGLITGLVAIFG